MTDRARLLVEMLAGAEGDTHLIGECIKAARGMMRDGSLERQPVDQVQAMAALLIKQGPPETRYLVPDKNVDGIGGYYQVRRSEDEFWCRRMRTNELCSRGNCDHVQAVKLYLAQKEQANATLVRG